MAGVYVDVAPSGTGCEGALVVTAAGCGFFTAFGASFLPTSRWLSFVYLGPGVTDRWASQARGFACPGPAWAAFFAAGYLVSRR